MYRNLYCETRAFLSLLFLVLIFVFNEREIVHLEDMLMFNDVVSQLLISV